MPIGNHVPWLSTCLTYLVSIDDVVLSLRHHANLGLVNGWMNYGGSYARASYSSALGISFVGGLVKRSRFAHGSTIAGLPHGHRPQFREAFAVSSTKPTRSFPSYSILV